MSKVDVTPPTSFGSLTISSVSVSSASELQSIQVNGKLLSVDYIQKLKAALTQAWITANSGMRGTFVSVEKFSWTLFEITVRERCVMFYTQSLIIYH